MEAAIVIPRHAKAIARDDELLSIRAYLDDPVLPPSIASLPDSPSRTAAATKFIRRASDFFVLDGQLWRKHHSGNHKLVIPSLVGSHYWYKRTQTSGTRVFSRYVYVLLERFWWPSLEEDVKWFIKTCHECQLRLTRRIAIPPTVPPPFPIFRKFYIDTFLMPASKGFRYVVHARCSLTSYPEGQKLRSENTEALANFIWERLLCRYGPIEELVTDNAPQYIAAVKLLAERYHIHHIRISPYNSRAQGPIERRHYDVRESILKATDGTPEDWPDVHDSVFWAERVTIQKSTGIAHTF